MWTVIQADLHRYAGRHDWRALLSCLFHSEGFRYTFILRCCQAVQRRSRLLYLLARLLLRRYQHLYGISINPSVTIGPGLYIGHFGGLVVNDRCVIGTNCNLSHGVTIGESYRGDKQGRPTIGDHVFIGPGAKLFGDIHVGDHAAIGANSVVTKDVPPHAVMVGIPAKIVSLNGSAGYINQTDYPLASAQ